VHSQCSMAAQHERYLKRMKEKTPLNINGLL